MKNKSFITSLLIILTTILFNSCEKDNSILQDDENLLEETYIYEGKQYLCKYRVINDSILEDYSDEYTSVNNFIDEIMDKPTSGIVELSGDNIKYLFDTEKQADIFLLQYGKVVPKTFLKSGGAPSGSQLKCYRDINHTYLMFDCFNDAITPTPNYYPTEEAYGFSNMYIYYKGWNDEMSSIYIKNTDASKYLVTTVFENETYGGHYIKFVISNNSNSNSGVVNYSDNLNTDHYLFTNTAQTKDFRLRRLSGHGKKQKSWNDQVSSIKWYWIDPSDYTN